MHIGNALWCSLLKLSALLEQPSHQLPAVATAIAAAAIAECRLLH
jgi:hypothetical protein